MLQEYEENLKFWLRFHPFGRPKPAFDGGVDERGFLRQAQDTEFIEVQGEPRAPRPEPFDKLKVLSSIEGIGLKASPGLQAGKSRGSGFS
jgi:hypothetical protein